MRVRGFTQDDAHIFCLPEQLEDEIVSVLDLTEAILNRFGFDRRVVVVAVAAADFGWNCLCNCGL